MKRWQEKHGGAKRSGKHPLYATWSGMRQRCRDPNHIEYERYAARGITVCDAWLDFAQFVKDVGPKPTPRHSLDRIDNDKGYSPDNVKWSTPEEQGRNTRRNHMITHGDETMCLVDWAVRLQMDPSLLRWRLKNWTTERALISPVRKQTCEFKG